MLKLCVIARDAVGNEQTEATATAYSWTKDTASPTAVLATSSNPTNVAGYSRRDADGVTSYDYAVITGASDCSSASYTTAVSEATPITGTATVGTWKVCVKGIDAASNKQAIFTEHVWEYVTLLQLLH